MRKFGILGVALVAFVMLTHESTAGRKGGAVRGGMRGAVVGEVVGGESGRETGAKIGVVTGATRTAIDRETTARATYQATTEYQNAPRSNFNEAPPEFFGAAASGTAQKGGSEAVIKKNGAPLLGVTFPADWKQRTGDNYVAAVSPDGQAYSMFVALDKVTDKTAAIKRVQEGLAKMLKDVKYDEASETKGGATIITGAGKTMKTGVEVVFAAGVLDADKGQLVGAAFIIDDKVDEHYKQTIRGICQTIRRAKDFGK